MEKINLELLENNLQGCGWTQNAQEFILEAVKEKLERDQLLPKPCDLK